MNAGKHFNRSFQSDAPSLNIQLSVGGTTHYLPILNIIFMYAPSDMYENNLDRHSYIWQHGRCIPRGNHPTVNTTRIDIKERIYQFI